MKLLSFAIASIVDANTGQGLIHHHNQFNNHDTEQSLNRGREIRSRSIITVIRKLSTVFSNVLERIRSISQNRRDIASISRLDEHLLNDIGVSANDQQRLGYGQITLEQLASRRGIEREYTKTAQSPSKQTAATISRIDRKQQQSANLSGLEYSKCG